MNRRHLLLAASGIVPAIALAGCSGQTPASLTTYVQAISAGLSGILSDIQAIPGVNIAADTVAQIQSELTVLANDAANIGNIATPGAQTVASVANVLAALVPLVTPFFPAAPFVAVAVNAAVALVPVLFSLVNMPVPAGAPKAVRALTPAAALLQLQASAARYGA